jgi:AraC-like DNA-binding protein
MELFSSIVEMIIHKRLIQFQDMKQFASLIELLNEKPEKNITLEEAAHMSHMSPSGFSHQFHKITGLSFRQFQIENRISKAEESLRSGEMQTVQETAYRFGFQSAFYFSRLFKKYRGYSPSTLLQNIS